jgi:intracellular septation protein
MTPDNGRKKVNPLLKLVLEMGPLALFFLANSKPALFHWLVGGFFPDSLPAEKITILTATAVLIAAVLVSLAASLLLTKHVPIMPVVTAIAVVFFGGLTLYFQDQTFIQLKPTIVNSLFGAALLGALAFGKLLLPVALDSVLHLDEEGWRKLTFRWGLFFFLLAGLNEVVRRYYVDYWVTFKSFGIMPLTVIFALSQTPLIMKHEIKPEAEPEHF